MNNIDFNIELFIEQYGIKNLRVCWPTKAVSYGFATLGIGIVSSNTPDTKIMHKIDEKSWNNNPGYKICFIPDDVYKVTIIDGDNQEIGEMVPFPKKQHYVSDFNQMMLSGSGSLYLATEDGYDILFGVYPEVTSKEELDAITWGSNVLNSMHFHQQTTEG